MRSWLYLLFFLLFCLVCYHLAGLLADFDRAAFYTAVGREGNWKNLLLAVVLMPLNWLAEARKWHLLLTPFLDWSYRRTLLATLAGVGVSAATPNRVGEIGGRLLMAGKPEWAGVIASSVLGSFCQWAVFLLVAWPALVWALGRRLAAWVNVPEGLLWPVGPLLLLGLAAGGKPLLIWVLSKVHGLRGIDTLELRNALANVKGALIFRATGYATARFFVYCTQLLLLLWFFGLELDPFAGLTGIMAIYLVQAGVPLPPGLNLVTRAELGILLWQLQDSPTAVGAVLAAFTALFALNVLLPALPAYWFLARKQRAL